MARLFIQVMLFSIHIFFVCHLWAATYDPLLLRAQASIFPKVVLLDKEIGRKVHDNRVLVTIVHTSQDSDVAIQLQKLIEGKYGHKLGGMKLEINNIGFDDINDSEIATAYIVLAGREMEYEKVVSLASSNNRIVFSYNYEDFKHDALISLHVKEKAYIYINKSTVHAYNIKFEPIFYKLLNIIE